MARPVSVTRRPEIVDGLRRVLMAQGLVLPSNDVIAQEASMSRQLIRHYFPEQRDMALALCRSLASGYQELLTEGVSQSGSISRLSGFLDFYFGIAAEGWPDKPRDDQAYDALFSLAAGDAELKELLKGQYDLLASVLSHELCVTYPSLPVEAAKELALIIVSMMYGHWKMVCSLGFDEKQNKAMRECVDRLIQSYVAIPPDRERSEAVDEPADAGGPNDLPR